METKFTHRIGICFCFVASVVCAGAHGVVEVDSVETDIGGGLVILPDELKGRTVNLAERCALQLQGEVSSFFINGQGGLPVWASEIFLPALDRLEEEK